MENYRDTPLARFNTFWWGLALIFAFGIIAVVLRPILHADANDVDDLRADDRKVIKKTIDAEQDSLLEAKKVESGFVQLAPSDTFEAIAPDLLSSKPEAVRTAKQAIPGTATEKRLKQEAAGN